MLLAALVALALALVLPAAAPAIEPRPPVMPLSTSPIMGHIGDRQVDEDQMLTFKVTATDPDPRRKLTFYALDLPTGASFDPVSQVFTWTPYLGQAGLYRVRFTVVDNADPPQTASEAIDITVNHSLATPPDLLKR
jgi:hypothetical protein